MKNNNNIKFVPWKVFTWIFGIALTLILVSYGYLYTQMTEAVRQVQANTIMINRLDERLSNILITITEIKDILKGM